VQAPYSATNQCNSGLGSVTRLPGSQTLARIDGCLADGAVPHGRQRGCVGGVLELTLDTKYTRVDDITGRRSIAVRRQRGHDEDLRGAGVASLTAVFEAAWSRAA